MSINTLQRRRWLIFMACVASRSESWLYLLWPEGIIRSHWFSLGSTRWSDWVAGSVNEGEWRVRLHLFWPGWSLTILSQMHRDYHLCPPKETPETPETEMTSLFLICVSYIWWCLIHIYFVFLLLREGIRDAVHWIVSETLHKSHNIKRRPPLDCSYC